MWARRTREHYLDIITMTMSGMAAEQLLLGRWDDGASVGGGSDLHEATKIAVALERSYGLPWQQRLVIVRTANRAGRGATALRAVFRSAFRLRCRRSNWQRGVPSVRHALSARLLRSAEGLSGRSSIMWCAESAFSASLPCAQREICRAYNLDLSEVAGFRELPRHSLGLRINSGSTH